MLIELLQEYRDALRLQLIIILNSFNDCSYSYVEENLHKVLFIKKTMEWIDVILSRAKHEDHLKLLEVKMNEFDSLSQTKLLSHEFIKNMNDEMALAAEAMYDFLNNCYIIIHQTENKID